MACAADGGYQLLDGRRTYQEVFVKVHRVASLMRPLPSLLPHRADPAAPPALRSRDGSGVRGPFQHVGPLHLRK